MGIFVLKLAALICTTLFCVVVVFLLPYVVAVPVALAAVVGLMRLSAWAEAEGCQPPQVPPA